MIEDRLAQTLHRVTAAATTALALVAVVAAGVVLPRLDRDSDRRPRLYVSGVAGPERWQRGPLVAVAPQGRV